MTGMEDVLDHTASDRQLAARRDLERLFDEAGLQKADLLFNLGLFARSGVLVKFLLLADLYKRFMHLPGVMCEFGVWLGQNAVLMENCRAIFESFHKRPYLGFDTWAGYPEKPDFYNAGASGKPYLEALLDCHVRMNVNGHLPSGHTLIEGDVCETAPAYFAAHPETIIAFAYFDMGPLRPTAIALNAIKPHLVSGSILLMDELTLQSMPGEAVAFKKVFSRDEYTIEKCALYPSKSIVTVR